MAVLERSKGRDLIFFYDSVIFSVNKRNTSILVSKVTFIVLFHKKGH